MQAFLRKIPMARIPETDIERLKTEVSLERLVASAGIELASHGADRIGRCPFHDDRTPSLIVSPKKNLWHCLGACNTGGDVIAWVMRTRGVSFRHAVELLKKDHPSLAAPLEKIVRKDTRSKLDALREKPSASRAATRHSARIGARALQRIHRDPGIRPSRQCIRDVRPQDHGEPAG